MVPEARMSVTDPAEPGPPDPGSPAVTAPTQVSADLARAIDPHPYALIVWDGEPGDGPGGTSGFVALLGRISGDERIVVIDPAAPEAGAT